MRAPSPTSWPPPASLAVTRRQRIARRRLPGLHRGPGAGTEPPSRHCHHRRRQPRRNGTALFQHQRANTLHVASRLRTDRCRLARRRADPGKGRRRRRHRSDAGRRGAGGKLAHRHHPCRHADRRRTAGRIAARRRPCSTACSTREGVAVDRARALSYGCRCSRARLSGILETFSIDDLDHMAVDGDIVMTCEFCNFDFRFTRDEVHGAAIAPKRT